MAELAKRIADLPADKLRQLTERLGRAPGAPKPAAIRPAPEDRHEPFPLTDIQQAYWIGRQREMEMGGVSAHSYMEFASRTLDVERFETAWRRLIDRHDMLRAVMLPDGRQRVLPEVPPFRVPETDLRGRPAAEVEQHLAAVREEMSHQVLPADRWPLFELRATRLEDGVRLHFSFDIILADLWSFRLLLRDLTAYYEDPRAELAPIELTFRDYVLAERALREGELHRRSLEYWRKRLPQLPGPPLLPLARAPETVRAPRFARRRARLEAELWAPLKARAGQAGLTSSGLLLAAFSAVLATWSREPRFLINLTLFNRRPLHPHVNRVVGDFTSINLLAAEVEPGDSFAAAAKRVQEQLWRDLDHGDVSGVQLLRELAWIRGGVAQARVPVVFTSTLGQEERASVSSGGGGLEVESVFSISQTPQVWLDHQVSEEAGALAFNWDAVEELFPAGVLDDMFASYVRLLEGLAAGEEAWRAPIWRRVPEAHLALYAEANATAAPRPRGLLHAGFERQAAQAPERTALIAGDLRMTYGELAAHARRLGRRLRELGAAPGELVAVVAEKGWEQVAGVLGVLMSGAAYLPVEPAVPAARLRQILELGRVRLAVAPAAAADRIDWPREVAAVTVDREPPAPDEAPLAPVQSEHDLAYVIFTSGSTGTPKGVMIEHRSALNTVADVDRRFAVGPGDRVLGLSSLGFDLSVYDLFGPLSVGGAVVLPEPWAAREPGRWHELMTAHEVTVWNSVPALLEVLVEWAETTGRRLPPRLRLALLSGDWIPLALPDRARRLGDLELVSLGGATEGSIWSILHRIGDVDRNRPSIPYGRAMANQQMHVLDDSLHPRPLWVPGQVFIGGTGVARGYWQDEERTAASFVVHPENGERLYRTGDLGRWRPDGEIEFLGREDFQVKVQGYRIELGEVEAVLARHPRVRSCAAAALGEAQGSKRLVAYVVADDDGGDADGLTAELRRYLAERLPPYMVPASFVRLDALPLSATGKVDRKALPEPAAAAAVPAPAAGAAAAELERRVFAVIGSVLENDAFDPDVHLFELGATSVELVRIANLLEKDLGSRPSMDELVRLSTPRSVAGYYLARAARAATGQAAGPAPASAADPAWAVRPILDPAEREAFKARHPGIRRSAGAGAPVELVPADGPLAAALAARRSHRSFLPEAVPAADLGRLLAVLARQDAGGEERRLYPSASGLYPVQTYLWVKPGRVDGIAPGVWYHHPADHRLVPIAPGAEIDGAIYGELVNRPIFEEAAFALFLIAQAAAMAPMYGVLGRDFSLLEAGTMTQLLMLAAPERRLGLCPIGAVAFDRVRGQFDLDEGHVLLHSLLGGRIDPDAQPRPRREAAPAPTRAADLPREDLEL
jgi:amino acid adenylation domain-containing protein